MKKIISLTICILVLFSTKVFAQDFTEDDFFSGIDNGTGTDYDTWSAGWVRN